MKSRDGALALTIITGLSGAGKSLAVKRLEDAGFYCADNMPFRLLPAFVDQCAAANPRLNLTAVVIDCREAVFGANWDEMLHLLDRPSIRSRIIFLDCSNETLLRRYSETRRRHPLAGDGDVMTGIMRERALLAPMRERAHAVIDTSNTTPAQLWTKLEEALLLEPGTGVMIKFMSFGYKRGIPLEADMILDMRFLPNPFYEGALRPLSGLDAPVREYLFSREDLPVFFDRLETLLCGMMEGFMRQDKQNVVVAFGCTGGRHRSVLAADEMCARFIRKGYGARVVHRDCLSEKKDIQSRFHFQEDTP
ncbi:MAG: RNase adapter RapZ [Clostridiales bacterium]|nr:RNase adapter RapZ [Clostridiales bacterium]